MKVYKENILCIEHDYLQNRAMTIASIKLRLQLYN